MSLCGFLIKTTCTSSYYRNRSTTTTPSDSSYVLELNNSFRSIVDKSDSTLIPEIGCFFASQKSGIFSFLTRVSHSFVVMSESPQEHIAVAVRMRPMNAREVSL